MREWSGLLHDIPYRLVTLRDVGIDLNVEETGRTFRANAEIKARAYAAASGLLTLAEDSGLCVRALGGAPGVQSARWEGNDYEHKNRLLVRLLSEMHGAQRTCGYVAYAVLRHPDGREWRARGEVRGLVARVPAGTGGFGYDPIFYLPRYGATLAEVPVDVKHAVSHRGRAAKRIRPLLEQLLETEGGCT